ncbi:hypothetical protein [Geobacter sp. AOG1]|uniref:hypothetical protein n=1 Tax=Geobacter sp. AOG1 TaxID=1566346 RepID=UPI001CC76E09|nr:hypothetical protein [Geobacter sp. AOG1]GFE56803.1 hypothetical protein AOG1_06820 [Geobacter sp. AOG1]
MRNILCLLCFFVYIIGICSCSESNSKISRATNTIEDKISNCTGSTQSKIATYMKNYYPKIEVKNVKIDETRGKCTLFTATAVENGHELTGVTTITGHSKSNDNIDLQILSFRSQEAAENLLNNMCSQNNVTENANSTYNNRINSNVSIGNGQVYDMYTHRPLLGEDGRPLSYQDYRNGAKHKDPNHPEWPAQ